VGQNRQDTNQQTETTGIAEQQKVNGNKR